MESSDYTTNDYGANSKVSERRSLADIAAEFEGTVEVENRRYRLKVYNDAFIGRDACATLHRILLREDLTFTRDHALLLGRYIDKKYGLFEHVTHDHNTLKDDHLFYRFTQKSRRRVPPSDDDSHDKAFLERLLSGEESEFDVADEVFDEFAALTLRTEAIALSSSNHSSSSYFASDSVDSVRSHIYENIKRDGNSTRHSPKGGPKRTGFTISPPSARSKSPVRMLGFRIPRSLSPLRPRAKRSREGRSSLFVVKDIDLQEAAKAFEIGVEVKTNRYHGEAFKCTFVGTDAVDFLIASRFATSRTMAEKLGQALAREFNLFQHVTQEHEFSDDFLFYRFAEPNERRALAPANGNGTGAFTKAPTLEEMAQEFEKNIPVCDRRYRLKVYNSCFLGHAAVALLVRCNFANSRSEAVDLGRRMASELNLFEHVTGHHELQDDVLFYKFTDPSKRMSRKANNSTTVEQDGLPLLVSIAADFRRGMPVKTHAFRFILYKRTFVGSEAVDFLVNSNLAPTRRDAVALGRRLAKELNLFHHVKCSHDFKDDLLFYRFTEDEDGASSVASEDFSTRSTVEMLKLVRMMRENIEVKNRRWYHNTYEDTFLGSDAVTFLINVGAAKTREEAVQLGRQVARAYNLFEHVERDHELQDERLFYRFMTVKEFEHTMERPTSRKAVALEEEEEERLTNSTMNAEADIMEVEDSGCTSGRLANIKATAQRFEKEVEVKQRRWRLRVYSNVFIGRDAVTYLVDSGLAESREGAVQIGQRMAKTFNLFEHVTQEHEFCDDCLFYRFVKVENRHFWIDSILERFGKNRWINSSELLGDSSGCLWKQKVAKFEMKTIQRDRSLERKRQEMITSDGVDPTSSESTARALKDWASRFRRLDPRYRICYFFTEVAQIGVENIEEKGVNLKDLRPILQFFFRASVFSIWRPTSFEAIRKMMLGQAVGKGLDIKGKSAKRGKLSAFVPFLQIGENRHKGLIRTLSKDGAVRLFFPPASAKSRDVAVANLKRICEEMLDTCSRAKQVLADENSNKESREEANESLLLEMTDPVIRLIDDCSPQSYGVEIPVRLFWEAFIVRQDITRRSGSQYDTGRPSCPCFQDMNFAALRSKPRQGHPRAVIWQNADPTEPMNPQELLMAYEENSRVLPVVSDFDPFLVGTRRVPFDPIDGQLPSDQLEIMKWSVDRIGEILDSPPGPVSWTNRWLDTLKEATSKGFHPEIPRFGFGDPRSCSIMENAVKRFRRGDGAVRHGSECFNYYFPQELDEEFLVISDKFDGVSWRYMDTEGMQDFLNAQLDDGYTFPLNPKWIMCDPGWKDIYDKLVASKNETVQASMQIWFPPSSGVREQIEDICARHPSGFQRERKTRRPELNQ